MGQTTLQNGSSYGTIRTALNTMLTELYAAIATFIPTALMGAANGVATLDNTGKIPLSQIPSLGGGGDALTTNPLSQFAATTSLQLKGVISDETGSGSLVFSNSPTLTSPALGTPSSINLTNGTALPVSTGLAGLGSGVATLLGVFSSANMLGALADKTGTGTVVFSTSPTLVTPNLGTPTALNLTNATALPVATGISGLATGVATLLAGFSSANLAAALTDETGTGSAVFGTNPILTSPTISSPTVNQIVNKLAKPTTTGTGVGTVISGYNAGATIAQFQVVYLGSGGTWLLADADGTGTRQARGLAAAAGTSGNPMDVIDSGIVRNDTWSWTPGGDIYLSTTPGALTQTAPTSGADVRRIGYAISATDIRVQIDSFFITV
jgi:hypothetical protein